MVLFDLDQGRGLRLAGPRLEKWSLRAGQVPRREGFDTTETWRDAWLLAGEEPSSFWAVGGGQMWRCAWRTLSPVSRLQQPGAGLQILTGAPQAHRAALVDAAGHLFVVDLGDGTVVAEGVARRSPQTASLASDGRRLALADAEQDRVTVYDVARGGLEIHLESLDRRHASVPTLAVGPCRARLVFAPVGDSLLLWESGSPDSGGFPMGWRGNLLCFDAASGRFGWSAVIDGELTGDARDLEAAGHPGGLNTQPAFSPDGRQIYLGSTAGTVLVFDAADGALVRQVHGGTSQALLSLGVDVDGKELWGACELGRFYDLGAALRG